MKKIISTILVSAIALSVLGGCGNSQSSTPAPTPSGTSSEVSQTPKSDYPNGPIKIIVVRKAGGSADVVARMYAPFLQKAIGANVIVENIDGGSGKIGLSQVFRANPDGYTLVLGNFPSYVLTQHIEGGVDYTMDGFTPVVGISGNEGNVLIVPGDSPFNTVEELIKYDQENSGKLNIAVTSGLSNSSLAHAMFMDQTKLSAQVIPYEDGNSSVTAVMGKQVDVAVCSAVAAYQPSKEKTIKVLTTFGMKSDDKLPGVPTFASIYGEEFAYDVSMGILAPPNMPADVLEILTKAAHIAATDPEFIKTAGESFSVVPLTAEELAKSIKGNYDLANASKLLLEKLISK